MGFAILVAMKSYNLHIYPGKWALLPGEASQNIVAE
jgi:hypothetical protein